MKKLVIAFIFFSGVTNVHAQTGIGTTTPNASAKLDVYSTNKGFLPPRVTLTSATDASTIASPAEGLLVYHLGSVGLQAGYYYWNGANWATIATATSAGNGVTSMEMTKLYAKRWVSGSVIESTNGQSFTVPVSGRYVFDFSSTCYAGNAVFTYIFQIRSSSNGVLAADTVVSANNNQHVEYNGKVEVNLQANTSYNVYVNTTGVRDVNDYDRVYYKLIAGNLPVTGQTVDYAMASLSANQSITAATNIQFNTIQGAGITLNNGGFNLMANKTYKLEGAVGGSSTGYIYYAWVDATNTMISGGSVGSVMKAGAAYTDGPQDKAVAYYTPTANTTVYLRVLSIAGTSVAYPASASPTYASTWASINQVGSSAIINPWVLTGNDVYNNTGKVGIGTTTPSAKLDVTGDVNVTGKMNLSDPTGSVIAKMAAFANENVPVTLGDIQVQMAPSGLARSLQIKTTGTSFTGMVTAYTSYNGASGTNAFTYFSDITQTINSSFAHLGTTWGFAQSGDVANYFVRDTTNQRFWRITLMVGASFNNNFIIIERLL